MAIALLGWHRSFIFFLAFLFPFDIMFSSYPYSWNDYIFHEYTAYFTRCLDLENRNKDLRRRLEEADDNRCSLTEENQKLRQKLKESDDMSERNKQLAWELDQCKEKNQSLTEENKDLVRQLDSSQEKNRRIQELTQEVEDARRAAPNATTTDDQLRVINERLRLLEERLPPLPPQEKPEEDECHSPYITVTDDSDTQ